MPRRVSAAAAEQRRRQGRARVRELGPVFEDSRLASLHFCRPPIFIVFYFAATSYSSSHRSCQCHHYLLLSLGFSSIASTSWTVMNRIYSNLFTNFKSGNFGSFTNYLHLHRRRRHRLPSHCFGSPPPVSLAAANDISLSLAMFCLQTAWRVVLSLLPA